MEYRCFSVDSCRVGMIQPALDFFCDFALRNWLLSLWFLALCAWAPGLCGFRRSCLSHMGLSVARVVGRRGCGRQPATGLASKAMPQAKSISLHYAGRLWQPFILYPDYELQSWRGDFWIFIFFVTGTMEEAMVAASGSNRPCCCPVAAILWPELRSSCWVSVNGLFSNLYNWYTHLKKLLVACGTCSCGFGFMSSGTLNHLWSLFYWSHLRFIMEMFLV